MVEKIHTYIEPRHSPHAELFVRSFLINSSRSLDDLVDVHVFGGCGLWCVQLMLDLARNAHRCDRARIISCRKTRLRPSRRALGTKLFNQIIVFCYEPLNVRNNIWNMTSGYTLCGEESPKKAPPDLKTTAKQCWMGEPYATYLNKYVCAFSQKRYQV